MKRDFTTKNYDHFLSLIQQISDEQWCGLTDWFGDGYYYVKHWLGDLGLYNKTNNLEKYHKELLDKKDTSKSEIKAIFEEVSRIDTDYAADSAGRFGECLELLETYHEYVQEMSKIAATSCQVVAGGGKLSDFFTSKKIVVTMSKISTHLETILRQISYTADNFSKISSEYKDEYVDMYESLNQEDAKILDQVLSDPDLTADEIRDIKFITYTAPEPYKSIYIEHIKKYEVIVFTIGSEEADGNEGSVYYSSSGKIFLVDADSTFFRNQLGPYNTFFHESGHAIDDYENPDSIMLSREYEYGEKSLNDIIADDVTNYVSEYIDEEFPNLTESQKEQIMRSLNLTDDATYEYGGQEIGDKTLDQYRQDIIRHMNFTDLRGPENEAASDVYGGITNNALLGSYGHFKKPAQDGSEYTYWYSQDGQATNKQTSELWAEFFAAQMTQDEVALESIKKHFPNAYDAMEAMARDMVES